MRGLAALVTLSVPGLAFCAGATWVPSSTTPETFVRRTDMAMKTASSLSAETMCKAEMTNAKLQKAVAVHDGKLYIKSPKVFHLEFPVTSEAVYYSDWMTYYEVADGKKFGRRRRGGWKDFSAVTSRPPLNKGGVLNTWVIQGPSRVLGSIGTNHAPLAALLREARAAKAKVTVERSSGTPIPMERLKIVRKGDGKKILPIDLEIVAEPNRGLPLSMFTIGFDKRKKSVALRWAAKWNMNPKQDFQTEYFTFKQ